MLESQDPAFGAPIFESTTSILLVSQTSAAFNDLLVDIVVSDSFTARDLTKGLTVALVLIIIAVLLCCCCLVVQTCALCTTKVGAEAIVNRFKDLSVQVYDID